MGDDSPFLEVLNEIKNVVWGGVTGCTKHITFSRMEEEPRMESRNPVEEIYCNSRARTSLKVVEFTSRVSEAPSVAE